MSFSLSAHFSPLCDFYAPSAEKEPLHQHAGAKLKDQKVERASQPEMLQIFRILMFQKFKILLLEIRLGGHTPQKPNKDPGSSPNLVFSACGGTEVH